MDRFFKSSILILLFLILAGSAGAEAFYSSLSSEQKADLALSYLMVSRRYTELEEPSRASDFQKMALRIYPAIMEEENRLLKKAEQEEDNPSAAPHKPQAPASQNTPVTQGSASAAKPAPVVPERIPRPDFAIKYYFNSLLRSFFLEDVQGVAQRLDDPFMPPQGEELFNRSSVREALEKLFAAQDFETIPPSSIYDMSSLKINETIPAAGDDLYGSWEMEISLLPDAPAALAEMMPAWGETQRLLFRYDQKTKKWYLSRVEFDAPPKG